MLTSDELDKLISETGTARNAYLSEFGQLDGNWSTSVNPRFSGGVIWPTLPAWQRIVSLPTTMIASSGLTDPWYESESPNTGMGIEMIVATNDALPDDTAQLMGMWIYAVATAISNAAVSDRLFAVRYDKYGPFLFGVPQQQIFGLSNEWICFDGCYGFLVGLPIPEHRMTFSLPSGEARLLTAKLITPEEYAYVANNGPVGAEKLMKIFTSEGACHLSSIARRSVI